MKNSKNIRLPLTSSEKEALRKRKVAIAALVDYPPDELEVILNTSFKRARELHAMAQFQTIPSIGVKFAEDLLFMDLLSLDDLKNRNAAILMDEFEQRKGYKTDPCVEDQFRLAVHYANTSDRTKRWWDFTAERKKYRSKHGYPSARPKIPWFEIASKVPKK